MTEVKKEFDIELDVTWDGNTAEIDPESFVKNLPAHLPLEVFEEVDSFRGQVIAAAADLMYERGQTHFETSDSDLNMASFGMGGSASLDMTMSSDFQIVSSVTVSAGDALDIVLSKAKDFYKEKMSEQ